MIREYMDGAMRKAKYEILEDDASYYGEIPECPGVWANAKTLEECREELEAVLEDWLLVGISLHHTLPIIDGLDINSIHNQPIAA
jgi:predicted RNase H-like HicB family nuclease